MTVLESEMVAKAAEFGPGALAYLDTVAGLVPCKALAVNEPGRGWHVGEGEVQVQVTTKRGAWKKGEVLAESAGRVVPRCMAHYRGRISSLYIWRGSRAPVFNPDGNGEVTE